MIQYFQLAWEKFVIRSKKPEVCAVAYNKVVDRNLTTYKQFTKTLKRLRQPSSKI